MANTYHHFHVEGKEWRRGTGSSILVAIECTYLKAKSPFNMLELCLLCLSIHFSGYHAQTLYLNI